MAVRYRPTLVICHYQTDPEWAGCMRRYKLGFRFAFTWAILGREWLARRMDRQGLR